MKNNNNNALMLKTKFSFRHAVFFSDLMFIICQCQFNEIFAIVFRTDALNC